MAKKRYFLHLAKIIFLPSFPPSKAIIFYLLCIFSILLKLIGFFVDGVHVLYFCLYLLREYKL